MVEWHPRLFFLVSCQGDEILTTEPIIDTRQAAVEEFTDVRDSWPEEEWALFEFGFPRRSWTTDDWPEDDDVGPDQST